jgi:diaminopimelate epimerase
MKEITFYKMVAAGNDFVVMDNRKGWVSDPVRLTREIAPRQTGVGADGVLLLEIPHPRPSPLRGEGKGEGVDYRLRIFNSNGSEAEACGNGFRCVALLANGLLGLPEKQRFETLSGVVEAEVRGNRVRVRLADPADFRNHEEIEVSGRELHYSFIRVGVPHVVIFVEGLSQMPVFEIGKEIRFHPRFEPAGTNVNFVEVTGSQSIGVRTYERGVEEETLACGTGATASAIVSGKVGHARPPVQVKTQGGEILTVDFTQKGNEIRQVYLEGEAKLVFEGKWKV